MADDELNLPTPSGPARARWAHRGAAGLVCLGHGAGGGVDAPDLAAVAAGAGAAGWSVALVEQPYRVAGRRAPDRAPRLDAAWVAVVAALRAAAPDGPLVVGGRSSGARVACRTAAETGADAVVCLAFPLHPPLRPDSSRLDELEQVGVRRLVVQGERDPFGRPDQFPTLAGVQVVAVPGDHSLRHSADGVAAAVVSWLATLTSP